MKLKTLLIGTSFIFLNFIGVAQETDQDRECKRMRFLAGEALKIQNYPEAAMYYLKGETICGGYEADNYERLLGTLKMVINGETDKARKTAYTDTIVGVYERTEKAGTYNQKDDLVRAAYLLNASKPDSKKADALFQRGIATQGKTVQEAYVSYYYYNLYALWFAAPEAEKPVYKKRLIAEFFALSKLVGEANMSAKAQENLTTYFNYVVRSCDDILPELGGFMSSFSQDPAVKKVAVINLIKLLESKECTSANQYVQLIDTLVVMDPSSLEAQQMKAKAQLSKKDYRGAIATLNTAKELATDAAKKNEITYDIARAHYLAGSYTSAYNVALTVSGEWKGEALIIAGKSVGSNANNCGNSTFERKCNYIYAVQLLQQGKSLGASDGGASSNYTKQFPTEQEVFENGSPASVTLSCYGVSVSPK